MSRGPDNPHPKLLGKVDGIPGWYYCRPFWDFCVDRFGDGSTFVEAGVLFGSASHGLAKAIEESGKKIQVAMVDSFKWENLCPKSRRVIVRDLKLTPDDKGFRDAFDYYRRDRAHERRGIVVEGQSPEVASHFKDQSIDMLMLDNAHEYTHLTIEIEAWRSKIKPGGILAAKIAGYRDGQYNDHPGVKGPMVDAFQSSGRLKEFSEIVWYADGF